MAFQTEKSTSSGEGPSATAPPSPPPSDNVNHNPFSPAGSPPLILAFLAIGLFAAAMVTVLGFRRVQHVRSFGLRTMGNPFPPESEPAPPRPKPQLWEVGLQEDNSWRKVAGYEIGYGGQSVGHWASMMPLAANAVTTTLSQLPQDTKPLMTSTRPDNILDNTIIGYSRGRLNGPWPNWRPIPMGHVQSAPVTSTMSSDTQEEVEVSKTLQVGAIILMPSSTNPLYRKRTDQDEYCDKKRKREDCKIPDYSIGSYERDWQS